MINEKENSGIIVEKENLKEEEINLVLKNHSPDQLFNKEDDIQSFFFYIPFCQRQSYSLYIVGHPK